MRKLQYHLSEVKPRIFFLNFKDQYQCNMFFLRFQEFYESPFSQFRGKVFSLIEFMDYYVANRKERFFTYPVDWAGFNVPSEVVHQLLSSKIPDRNAYDLEMKKVYDKCLSKYPDGRFYLIGAVGKGHALKHELAHGFFYTTPEYKKQMTALVKKLPVRLKKQIFSKLKAIGYTQKVLIDECQAYLATGADALDIKPNGKEKPFEKTYNEFYKRV